MDMITSCDGLAIHTKFKRLALSFPEIGGVSILKKVGLVTLTTLLYLLQCHDPPTNQIGSVYLHPFHTHEVVQIQTVGYATLTTPHDGQFIIHSQVSANPPT